MKLRSIVIGLALLTGTVAHSEPIELIPVVISGTPGGASGWGFSVESDPLYYISIASAFVLNESSPGSGIFTDWISMAGGPSGGVLAPGAASWTQAYDPVMGTGFGEFAIAPFATPGTSNLGEFLVAFLRFSDDPATCGSCFVDAPTVTLSFRVDVLTPASTTVPEPGPAAPIFIAGLLFAAIGGVRRSWRSGPA